MGTEPDGGAILVASTPFAGRDHGRDCRRRVARRPRRYGAPRECFALLPCRRARNLGRDARFGRAPWLRVRRCAVGDRRGRARLRRSASSSARAWFEVQNGEKWWVHVPCGVAFLDLDAALNPADVFREPHWQASRLRSTARPSILRQRVARGASTSVPDGDDAVVTSIDDGEERVIASRRPPSALSRLNATVLGRDVDFDSRPTHSGRTIGLRYQAGKCPRVR